MAVEVARDSVRDQLHEVRISENSQEAQHYRERVRGLSTDGTVMRRATTSISRMMRMVVVLEVAWQLKG